MKRRQHKDFKAMRIHKGTLKTKQQCNPEKFQEKISERLERDKPKTVKKERLKLAKLILTGMKLLIREFDPGSG